MKYELNASNELNNNNKRLFGKNLKDNINILHG